MAQEITESDIEFYTENGYFIVNDAFSKTEMDEFDRALLYVTRAFTKQAAEGVNPFASVSCMYDEIDLATLWLEEQDYYYIAQLYHAIADIPEFLRLGIKRELSQIAARLLSGEAELPLYALTKRCRIDLPCETDYAFGLHQEAFYSIPESRFLQTWAPLLRPSTKQNGAIEIAVGSHKDGVTDQTWNSKDGVPNQILVKDEVIKRYEIKTILLEPGQLVMFSNKTAHRSGINTSGSTRFSLVSSFHRIDSEDFQAPRFQGQYLGIDPQDYYGSLLREPSLAVGETFLPRA
ncbi:MAG: hypothetical protein ACI97A_000917 [Planctomycetota bacterium]|jgi:hypothetical protein